MKAPVIAPRPMFALIGVACLLLVGAGLVLQSVYRLQPCPLCIFQRLLYIVAGVIGLSAWALPQAQRLGAALIGGLAALGAGVAGYQTWMQAYPELAPECSFTDPNLIERLVDWLGMQWPAMFMATGFCTSRDWVFLGLSMANWSLLVFLGLLGLALWLLRRR